MKGSVVTDLEQQAVLVDGVELRAIEDVDLALSAIKAASRTLWPDLVFAGEDGFDDTGAEEPAPRAQRQKSGGGGGVKAIFKGGAPAPGSFSAQVRALADEGLDQTAIADRLDVTTNAVGASLSKLRKAGLIS